MKIKIFTILIVIFLLLNCKSTQSGAYVYKVPENINDGLETGSIDEVNIDLSLITKVVEAIYAGKFGEVHSMLIYKNDKLVIEEYFSGHQYKWDAPRHYGNFVKWNKNMPHDAQSSTKSITSACIGIAIEQGFIKNVNQSIFDYLPEHQYLKTDKKEEITIKHLLTMTSGLKWDEWNAPLSSDKNDTIGIWFHGNENPVQFILKRPLVAEPGTRFNYSGGDIHLLGEILRYATGMDLIEFSGKYLFKPLDINYFNWWLKFKSGMIGAVGAFKIKPRGMLKVGALYLNNGEWQGKRLISEEWVQKSSVSYNNNKGIKIPGEDMGKLGYGYTWWIKDFQYKGKDIHFFTALGWGGQKIIVIPQLNTVIVFTGGNYLSKVKQFKIIKKYIVPALYQSN